MTRAASTAERVQEGAQLPTPEASWSSLTHRPSCVALHLWDCVHGRPDMSLWMVRTQAQPRIPRQDADSSAGGLGPPTAAWS